LISSFSWPSFLRHNADAFHIVVQDGLLAPIVPLERYASPVRFGDGAKIILVATPADAGTDVQQPGLGASHSLAVSL
jgi:hypothetical protein